MRARLSVRVPGEPTPDGAHTVMKLNAKAVAAARFTGKPAKLYDGGGLHLHVGRTSRTWRYSYRLGGRPREYTIGPAADVSLAEARERHREARRLVLDGVDPVEARREARAAEQARRDAERVQGHTVGQLVDEWFARRSREWASSNTTKVASRLKHLPADFRARPLLGVTADHVLEVLETARVGRSSDLAFRLRDYLRGAFDEAIAQELVTANPVQHPKVRMGLGRKAPQRRYAHIRDPGVLAGVVRAIEGYVGDRNVTAALWCLPRLFLRPAELRGLRWSEVDAGEALLRIDGARMKAGRDHVVPVARQVAEVIEAQRRWTESSGLVFPGRAGAKPISSPTLGNALQRLGIGPDVLVPHGVRHTASSALNERTFDVDGEPVKFGADAIEAQLAHATPGVRGRYMVADFLPERRRMMQAWADWLDELAGGRGDAP